MIYFITYIMKITFFFSKDSYLSFDIKFSIGSAI